MTDQQKFMIAACAGLFMIALLLGIIAEAMLAGALRPVVHVHPPRFRLTPPADMPTWGST